MGPVIYLPLYEILLNTSTAEEKYFMSIFFPSVGAMGSWPQKWAYGLNFIIKIIYLPGHCYWFQHGHMTQTGTIKVLSMSSSIGAMRRLYFSGITSYKNDATFQLSYVKNLPENETNRKTDTRGGKGEMEAWQCSLSIWMRHPSTFLFSLKLQLWINIFLPTPP